MTRRVVQAMALAAAVSGCMPQSTYNLATNREEVGFVSTEKEVAMGRKIAKRVIEEEGLVEDAPLRERVSDIGQRIAAVCERRELTYQFAVLQGDERNAFSLPGGYVFIFEGLVKETSGDDELAGVLAHEVAHVAARHSMRRYEGSLGMQIAQLATLAAREPGLSRGVGMAMQSAQLAYSREEEIEADRLAVKYLTEAGFDPEAILSFMRKMHSFSQEDHATYMPRGIVRPHYARTHPFIPERILAVKEALYGVADYIDYLNVPR